MFHLYRKYMKKILFWILCLPFIAAQGQTARKFTLNLTDDGKAQMVCFLPEHPSGKAIVGVPGGGYSMLSCRYAERFHLITYFPISKKKRLFLLQLPLHFSQKYK